MRRSLLSLLTTTIFFLILAAAVKADSSANLFLLKKTDTGYDIEKTSLPNGQMMVFTIGPGSDLIDIIVPVGPGGSGSITQTGRKMMLVVRNDSGSLTRFYQKEDGSRYDMPDMSIDELRRYDIRLSVTGADSSTANFLITGYAGVEKDDIGPVMDMFAGQIPLNTGDYSIFTNTENSAGDYILTGRANLEFSGKYLFTPVEGPGGKEGLFVVDIGAATTIVTEAFLPENTETKENYMMEYSSAGARKLKYAPGGATGPIEDILGSAALDYLKFGDMTVKNARADVIADLPEIDGRRVDGIIGMDIMRSAHFLTLNYNTGKTTGAELIITDQRQVTGKAVELPFASIRKLLYVMGTVGQTPVHFLLDSGSPGCMLTPYAAEKAGIENIADSSITYQGGGRQKKTATVARIPSLKLGEKEMKDMPCTVGEIFTLQTIGRDQAAGLLGNAEMSRFARVEIDFTERLVRFEEK